MKMAIVTTYRNRPVLWPRLLAMSPSFESDTALPRNIATNRMTAKGRAKNTNIIQFSEKAHHTNTKNPTPMCTTLRTSLSEPRLSRARATASDVPIMA